jgi:hypothetical protein
MAGGVLAYAGKATYRNGLSDGTISGAANTNTKTLLLGCYNGPAGYFTGKIQTVVIASRTLSPAEMWLASRQVAYCEQNPDWNAWARRRRYFYAPSAAAISALLLRADKTGNKRDWYGGKQ